MPRPPDPQTPTANDPTASRSDAARDALILALQAQQPLAVGTATLVAGTKAVALATITASSTVLLTPKSLAGTVGFLSYTVSAGVGFSITSVSALDTSTVAFVVFP